MDDNIEEDQLKNLNADEENSTTKGSRELTEKQKWMRTTVLYGIYFGTGMFVAIFGPTLPVLQHQVGVDTKKGALLFTYGGIGRITGSFLQVALYETLATWFQLAIVLLLMPISAILLPQIQDYITMSFVFAFQGLAAGSLGSICNSYIFETWKLKAGPAIQGLHFIISIGSLCVTFVVKFFLPSHLPSVLTSNSTANISIQEEDLNIGDIFYPFLMIAVYETIVWIFVLAFLAESRFAILKKERRRQSAKASQSKPDFLLVFLFGIPMFCFGGFEVAYSGLLLTFVTEEVHWSTEQGAFLTFSFWAGIAFGRFISIFAVKCIKPRTIIATNLLILCTAFFVLSLTYTYNPLVMWICTFIIGATMAPLVANTLSLANNYLGVCGWVTSFHLGSLFTGVIALPALTAFLFKSIESTCFLYTGLGISIICVVVFILIEIIMHKRPAMKLPCDSLVVTGEKS